MYCCGLFSIILLVVCSFSVAVTGFPFKHGSGQYWRRMCDEMEEITDNSTCKDGVYKNPCGKLACLIGVEGECDEPRSSFRFGRCADGLSCVCGNCLGCLRGKECSTINPCNHKLPFARRMNNYPIEYPNNYNEY